MRAAFARMSGWYDRSRWPTSRTSWGRPGGPRRSSPTSASRRMPWAKRRAALAALRRMSMRPAPPAKSSRGKVGSVEAR